MIHKPDCPRYKKGDVKFEGDEEEAKEEDDEDGKEDGVSEDGAKKEAEGGDGDAGCCDAYLWVMSKGSTKKILSLIKTLPDKERFNDALRNIVGANTAEARKKRRFNKHPRRLPETRREKEPFIILKKPSEAIVTDSSDEYCDVTVRKQTLEEYDDIEIADHILANIHLEKNKSNHNKVDKDRENSVKRAVKKEERVEDEKPKEPPKLYIDRKLRSVIERSVQVLQDIESSLNFGLDPPDESEEFDRRRKRAMEFSSRFSRIHLYQLNRHVTDLQDIVRPPTGRWGSRTNVFSLNQKFHTANQTIYQGLQAYSKHLPAAIVVGVPEKLRDFLKITMSMCDLYREYSTKHPTGEEEEYNRIIESLENKCKEVSDKIEDTLSFRKPSHLQTSLSSVSLANSKRPQSMKRPKSSKSKRLSMYHAVPIRNDVYWKKAIASLSQKKFDVPSRYKTATFKHRPPPPPPQPVEKISFVPQKIVHPKSSNSCRCKPKNLVNDIDNVCTLVQAQDEKVQPGQKPQSQVMWNLAQGFFNKISKGQQAMTQDEYECILDHFITMVNNNGDQGDGSEVSKIGRNKLEQEAQELLEQKMGTSIENMDFSEFVEKLVESVNGNKKHDTCAEDPKNEESNEGDVHPAKKALSTEKKQTITITGPKNAPLICIKDDTSLAEPSEDEQHREEAGNKPVGKKGRERERGLKAESHNELVYHERPDSDFSKSISKLTRVHKHNLRQVEMLPKDTVIKIIEYKLQFHKETKNNCMYKKSGNMSPLHLVERISDKLLDEVLVSITRDIQVEEILQKIYAQEFK